MVRCILEAVACALGDQMAALCDGSPPGEIRCAGGAARSDLWLQIKADVLGVATAATLCPEPTSLGAAMLAQASLDGADVQTVARQWVRLKPPHRPDPQRHRQYQRAAMQNNNLMPPKEDRRFPRSRAGNQPVYLYMIVLVAAVGGFLFGYEIQLISGAIIFLKKEFSLTPVLVWRGDGQRDLGLPVRSACGPLAGRQVRKEKDADPLVRRISRFGRRLCGRRRHDAVHRLAFRGRHGNRPGRDRLADVHRGSRPGPIARTAGPGESVGHCGGRHLVGGRGLFALGRRALALDVRQPGGSRLLADGRPGVCA